MLNPFISEALFISESLVMEAGIIFDYLPLNFQISTFWRNLGLKV